MMKSGENLLDLEELNEPLEQCPDCGPELEESSITRHEQVKGRSSQGFPEPHLVETPISIVRCDAEENPCGWQCREDDEDILVGTRLPELPAECAEGHRHSWGNPEKVFARIEVECLALVGAYICGVTTSIGGQRQGFLRPGYVRSDLPHLVKLPLLEFLFEVPEGAAFSLGELREVFSNFTTGQLEGALDDGIKYHFIGAGPIESLVPRGRGRRYFIAERGRQWIIWARRQWFHPLVLEQARDGHHGETTTENSRQGLPQHRRRQANRRRRAG